MKKSYVKLIIFDIFIIIILLLNSFILNILGNYYYMNIFLLILLVMFRIFFGFEKGKNRYVKDIILNILIIYMICFMLYYIFGIFIGFVRTENYLNLYGIKTFIVPFIIMISLKEFLRFQMLNKTDKSKILTIVTCILFIMIDVSVTIQSNTIDSGYSIFIYLASVILPIFSNNIVCTYICIKNGYKPNIFWLLIAQLYMVFLPFVPKVGIYIGSLINFLFPFGLMYNVYAFYQKREKNIPISYMKKRAYIGIPCLLLFVLLMAYFVSGLFRYYTVAIATGSMVPNINVGDVVIVDQHRDYKDLALDEVIAYRHSGVIVVHRLINIVKVDDEYYFYTKGDANPSEDNYVIYPDTILGSVNVKIPYIGLPTVWLNDLFR